MNRLVVDSNVVVATIKAIYSGVTPQRLADLLTTRDAVKGWLEWAKTSTKALRTSAAAVQSYANRFQLLSKPPRPTFSSALRPAAGSFLVSAHHGTSPFYLDILTADPSDLVSFAGNWSDLNRVVEYTLASTRVHKDSLAEWAFLEELSFLKTIYPAVVYYLRKLERAMARFIGQVDDVVFLRVRQHERPQHFHDLLSQQRVWFLVHGPRPPWPLDVQFGPTNPPGALA